MYQGRVELTSNDILNKEFSIDTRGYRPQEVDSFLDQIIKDYKTMGAIIDELIDAKEKLNDENLSLKEEIRNLNMKVETLKSVEGDTSSSADVLRRLSNLEKIIYGKE